MTPPSRSIQSSLKLFLFAIVASFLAFAGPRMYSATWYLHADDGHDWNSTGVWWSQPRTSGTGGTHPTSISSADDFDWACFTERTPLTSGTNTFGGKTLVLHGGDAGTLFVQTSAPNALVIPSLRSEGGRIEMAGTNGNVPISVTTFTSNQNTTLTFIDNTPTRGMDFTIGTLTGAGDICANGKGAGSAGQSILLSATSASGFTGDLYINNGCQFTFKNAIASGGALDVGGAGTKVTLNAAVTFKGVTVDGTSVATGTYTAAQLGSKFAGTGSVVVQAPSGTVPPPTQLFGVNFEGGEATNKNYPVQGYYWDYYHGKGLNLIRVPFRWEYIQPALSGTLDATALSKLDTVVSNAASRGMSVILDMHNYGAYSSGTIGVQVTFAQYQDVWQKIAAHFASQPAVYGYDIMNEPKVPDWKTAAQSAVNGIRLSDATHNIFVEGTDASSAAGWMKYNADLSVSDPSNKIIYSAHSYWDSNGSGVYAGTYDSNNAYPNVGVAKALTFIYWLQQTGNKGHIGEFGVPANVASPDYRWLVALDNFMNTLNVNGLPATYWATYNISNADPLKCDTISGTNITNAPQLNILQNYGGVSASDATPFVTGVTAFGSLTNNFTGWKGMQVNTGTAAITVKALGRWVISGNSGTHTVELVRYSDKAILGSVTVNTASAPAGAFVYANLSTPVTLAASTTYYIASSETNGGDQSYNDTGTTLTVTGVGSVIRGVYSADNATWSIHASGSVSYGPVSFKY